MNLQVLNELLFGYNMMSGTCYIFTMFISVSFFSRKITAQSSTYNDAR